MRIRARAKVSIPVDGAFLFQGGLSGHLAQVQEVSIPVDGAFLFQAALMVPATKYVSIVSIPVDEGSTNQKNDYGLA